MTSFSAASISCGDLSAGPRPRSIQARADISSNADPTASVAEAQARKKLQAEFTIGLRECRRSLDEVSAMAEGEAPLDRCWSGYAEASAQGQALFGEILAFRLGALMRSERLDDGLFPIADALIWELAQNVFTYPPITILAESESIGQRLRIIRIRYPATIWEMPIAAHEFGHLVASERNYLDFEDFIAEVVLYKGAKTKRNLLEEYFADIFATYVLGPAFACAMILLRFEPGHAHLPPEVELFEIHPGDAKRVHCILKTLRRMEDSAPWGGWLSWVDARVRDLWNASLTAVQQRTDLDPKIVKELDDWVEKVFDLFDRRFAGDAPYTVERWNRATVLATHLGREAAPESVLSKDDTVRDLLNAAWFCRIQQAENIDQARRIGDTAIKWCLAAMRNRK